MKKSDVLTLVETAFERASPAIKSHIDEQVAEVSETALQTREALQQYKDELKKEYDAVLTACENIKAQYEAVIKRLEDEDRAVIEYEPDEHSIAMRVVEYIQKNIELPRGPKGDDGASPDLGQVIRVAREAFEKDIDRYVKTVKGDDGSSAYDIACEQGFTGSKAEWLESLRAKTPKDGASAYDISREQGFTGSKAEWLESLRAKTPKDGASAYDIALEQGYKGSKLEWLESLKVKGPRGEKGDNVTSALEVERILHSLFDRMKFSIDDGGREFIFQLGDFKHRVKSAAPVYRGCFAHKSEYDPGDVVTYSGSLWIKTKDGDGAPKASDVWQLCTKKPRDGEDGKDGAKGERGPRGARGPKGQDAWRGE